MISPGSFLCGHDRRLGRRYGKGVVEGKHWHAPQGPMIGTRIKSSSQEASGGSTALSGQRQVPNSACIRERDIPALSEASCQSIDQQRLFSAARAAQMNQFTMSVGRLTAESAEAQFMPQPAWQTSTHPPLVVTMGQEPQIHALASTQSIPAIAPIAFLNCHASKNPGQNINY